MPVGIKLSRRTKAAARRLLKAMESVEAESRELVDALHDEEWQQTTMADAIGVSVGYLNNVLNGVKPPSGGLAKGILGLVPKQVRVPKKKKKA